jgi:hypothetical protein
LSNSQHFSVDIRSSLAHAITITTLIVVILVLAHAVAIAAPLALAAVLATGLAHRRAFRPAVTTKV